MMRFHLWFLEKSEKTLQKRKRMKNKQSKTLQKGLSTMMRFCFVFSILRSPQTE